jgi:hypothetical protein
MSNKWTYGEELNVSSGKNIQGMFKSTGLAAYLPPGILKYVTQGFCTGSAANAAMYLIS